jgi:predicted Rossmann fold nucleotide-binding protein DprA/Smf involved in DNA uptake
LPPPIQTELFEEEEDPAKKRKGNKRPALPPELEALSEGEALTLDELAGISKMPISRLSALVMELEIAGLIKKRLDGKYESA